MDAVKCAHIEEQTRAGLFGRAQAYIASKFNKFRAKPKTRLQDGYRDTIHLEEKELELVDRMLDPNDPLGKRRRQSKNLADSTT